MEFCNPYVFVVGVARSGTTLLQRMLDHHPLLAVANDTHFIPWAVSGGEVDNPVMTIQLARKVMGYRRFHRFELTETSVMDAAEGATTFSSFVCRLYDEYARLRSKRFSGEKTPQYVRYIGLLHELFPTARFIHIVRDGRDVALSAMNWAVKDRGPDERGSTVRGPARHPLWDIDPLGATALWWATQVEEGAKAGDVLGPSLYHQVRYEDLVASPDEILRQLSLFLGLPHAPEMAAYYTGKHRKSGVAKSAKKAWMPATSGLRDWRTQMSVEDQSLFRELAGHSLHRFGYDPQIGQTDLSQRAQECWTRWHAVLRK